MYVLLAVSSAHESGDRLQSERDPELGRQPYDIAVAVVYPSPSQ